MNRMNRTIFLYTIFFLLPIDPPAFGGNTCKSIYFSKDLSGHSFVDECNPGSPPGTPLCSLCSIDDVELESLGEHGVVTSNVHERNTYVNAIGYKKFTETLPTGKTISLGRYKYIGYIKLPTLPINNDQQKENPDAVHMMIQFWDGRNALYQSDKNTLEGTIYWNLNPWSDDFGKIQIYTLPCPDTCELLDSGITLIPDTSWHQFEIIVDFKKKKYVSITVNEEVTDLGKYDLAQVHHDDWGEDVSLIITTESMAAWPGESCEKVYIWKTYFKDLDFSECRNPPNILFLIPKNIRKDIEIQNLE